MAVLAMAAMAFQPHLPSFGIQLVLLLIKRAMYTSQRNLITGYVKLMLQGR